MENPDFSFENYCRNCDHFPGDGNFPVREYWGKCPYKDEFKKGTINGDTNWKEIGCKDFWD